MVYPAGVRHLSGGRGRDEGKAGVTGEGLRSMPERALPSPGPLRGLDLSLRERWKRNTPARCRRHQGRNATSRPRRRHGRAPSRRAGRDGAVLRRQVLAPAEEEDVAALEGAARQLEEMAPRGGDQRVPARPPPNPRRKAAAARARRPSRRARRRAEARGNRSRRPSARPDGDRACRSRTAPRR